MQLTSVYMHAGIVSGPDEPSRAARDFRRRDVANATDLELDHGDSSRLQRGMLGGRCGGGGKCGAGTGQRGGGEREMSAGCSAELHWARRWCGAAAARAASGLRAGFVLPMAAVWRAALGALPWPEIPVHAPLSLRLRLACLTLHPFPQPPPPSPSFSALARPKLRRKVKRNFASVSRLSQ